MAALPRLWRETAPAARPAPGSLDIPLRPSPLAHTGVWLFLAAQLLYVLELFLAVQRAAALAVFGLAACSGWLWRQAGRNSMATPRRLLLAADGRLHVLTVAGTVEVVTLHPASLRLGRWMLLLFASRQGLTRVLLGPDNLEAVQLAGLQRRLGAMACRPEAVLYGGERRAGRARAANPAPQA